MAADVERAEFAKVLWEVKRHQAAAFDDMMRAQEEQNRASEKFAGCERRWAEWSAAVRAVEAVQDECDKANKVLDVVSYLLRVKVVDG